MADTAKDPFVIALSSSALFDTKEGDAIFSAQGEEAFIKHQIDNEDTPFAPGPAMPIAKALLAANAAIKNGPRIRLIILSHNNPAASVRAMKSASAHGLPVQRASFVGSAPLSRYLEADNVALLLSRNADDVRTAINQGIAAARVTECSGPLQLEENQLRVAFDWDAVIASDESERVYRAQGNEAYQANEMKLEKVPLKPGPFEPILRWMAELQREVAASGSIFSVRTAIVTARNEAAMNRVILTMRRWQVRVDETHFLGTTPKDRVLQAFRPHIFFDDQAKNLSGVVPGGHVLFGVANEFAAPVAPAIAPVPVEAAAPAPAEGGRRIRTPDAIEIAAAAAAELDAVTSVTKRDFETRCRAIFRSYTPLSQKGRSVDERFRVFVAENADRSGEERAEILRGLEKYNLADITQHDPTLNRELGDIVRDKLAKVVADAVAPKQRTLDLE
jgi:5'-nucleotidase